MPTWLIGSSFPQRGMIRDQLREIQCDLTPTLESGGSAIIQPETRNDYEVDFTIGFHERDIGFPLHVGIGRDRGVGSV